MRFPKSSLLIASKASKIWKQKILIFIQFKNIKVYKRRDLTSWREILSKIEHIVAITIIIPQRRRRTTTGSSRIIPESLQTPKRQPSCRRFSIHHNQNLNPSNPSPLPAHLQQNHRLNSTSYREARDDLSFFRSNVPR